MRKRSWSYEIFGGAFVVWAAEPASAHFGGGAQGFLSGLLHPVTGLDHLLAMVAVGIWGAFLGRPLIWLLPVAFPIVMVIGGVLGIADIPLPFVETGVAVSVILLGSAIAFAWHAPAPAAVLTISLFAIFHGYAHGKELPSAAAPEMFAAGFVLSTGVLHLTGIAIGLVTRLRGGVAALRVIGAVIATLGLWILWV